MENVKCRWTQNARACDSKGKILCFGILVVVAAQHGGYSLLRGGIHEGGKLEAIARSDSHHDWPGSPGEGWLSTKGLVDVEIADAPFALFESQDNLGLKIP